MLSPQTTIRVRTICEAHGMQAPHALSIYEPVLTDWFVVYKTYFTFLIHRISSTPPSAHKAETMNAL